MNVGEKVSEYLNHGQIFAVFVSTPLPESIKSKLSTDLYGENSDEFQSTQYSTPQGSFSGLLESEGTASNRLVNRRGKTVPRSNIKTVKNFLLSSKEKKQPPGTQAAIDLLAQRRDLVKKIRNPLIRKKLQLDQRGSGWISIRKF